MKVTTVVISSLVLIAAAFAVQQIHTDLRAPLSPPSGRAKGKVSFQMRGRVGRAAAEMEVEAERLARNAQFTVTVGNNAPFTVTSDGLGRIDTEQHFSSANAPTVVVGTTVTVEDATDAVVLTGVFAAH